MAALLVAAIAGGSGAVLALSKDSSVSNDGDRRDVVERWLDNYDDYQSSLGAAYASGPLGRTGVTFSGDATQRSLQAVKAFYDQCRIMRDAYRNQANLFPAPDKRLERALGEWIDAAVALWSACPSPGRDTTQLSATTQAKANAVERLVTELTPMG
jgi:hypothetical protein